MATRQLGTPSERPDDAATQESVDSAIGESPDAGSANTVQALRDIIFRTLADNDRVNNTNPDVQLALENIRPDVVTGVFGPADIRATLQKLLDIMAGKQNASLADAIARQNILTAQADQGARAFLVTEDHEPETHYFSSAATIQIPAWANYVDLRAVGKGGKGAASTEEGRYGLAGTPGAVNTTTLQRTEHFTGTPTITFTPASQSVSGTTFSVGAHTLTAADGSNAAGTSINRPVGYAPASFTHKGVLCETSGNQYVLGADGTTPGGAGNGQHWILGGTAVAKGGGGGGWVTFRADPLDGETVEDPEGDTTPPDIDDLDVAVTTTTNTITLTPSGAVDA